jgi:hypothetical protein
VANVEGRVCVRARVCVWWGTLWPRPLRAQSAMDPERRARINDSAANAPPADRRLPRPRAYVPCSWS